MAQPVPRDSRDLPVNYVLLVSASIVMECPASHAYNIMIDTSTWPEWNTFVPSVVVTPPSSAPTTANAHILMEGSDMAFQVRMKPSLPLIPQNEVVAQVSDRSIATGNEFSISWGARGFPRFLLTTMRDNNFRDLPSAEGGRCEYRTWLTMNGPMAYVVRTTLESTLQERFEDWANDLKAQAEKTWAERQALGDGGSR